MGRSGDFVKQPEGFRAFIPKDLPPSPPIKWDDELHALHSRADRALARLDGASENLPSLDLFVRMYARKEAALSSQIEGTQASLSDIIRAEADLSTKAPREDVLVTLNYSKAMSHGLKRLESLPVSLRLVREIHRILLDGVRGHAKTPGEFRTSQNWIGPTGATLNNAVFVPPPKHEMMRALGELEKFLHDDSPMPPLIKVGLAHAQFETVHPFLDGNGRVGRLLIIFLLCAWGIIERPVLYPSHTFKARRDDYYDRLQATRDRGDWEGWLKFFLEAMAEAAQDAYARTRAINQLREAHRALVDRQERGKGGGHAMLEGLFRNPYTTVKRVARLTDLSVATAGKLVERFEEYGLVREITGRERDRVFVYGQYLDLLEKDLDASRA